MDSHIKSIDQVFAPHVNVLKNMIDTFVNSSKNDNQKCIDFLLLGLRNYINLWKTYFDERSPHVDAHHELFTLIESLEDILAWTFLTGVPERAEHLENKKIEQNGRNKNRQGGGEKSSCNNMPQLDQNFNNFKEIAKLPKNTSESIKYQTKKQKRMSNTNSLGQNNQLSHKAILEKNVPDNNRRPPMWLIIKNKRRLQEKRERARKLGIRLPTDENLFKLLTKATKISEDRVLGDFPLSILGKFATAMEIFASFSKTHDKTLYEKSLLCFSNIPKLDYLDGEKSPLIMDLVRKIKNLICRNYPKFHIPPVDVIDKIVLLVQSIKTLSNQEKLSTKEQDPHPQETLRSKKQLDEQCLNSNQSKENEQDKVNHELEDSHLQETLWSKKQLSEQCLNFIQSKETILDKVNHLLEQAKTCVKAKDVEIMLLADLGKIIEVIYPRHKLWLYGSRASGLALPDSDFDIFCDITGDCYDNGMDHDGQRNSALLLASQLEQNSEIFSEVISILDTKVPIVKYTHNLTGTKCDVIFKNGSTERNTQLLKVYLNLDPRVSWVLTAVKLWAQFNQIIMGSNNFTSFGVNWLVLFYLMKEEVVPPVIDLQTPCEPRMINNWNVAFQHPEQWEPKTQASQLELFKGFFTWIIGADLTAYCVCTFTGDLIPKETLADMDKMKMYKGGVFKEYVERIEMEKPKVDFQLSSYDMIEMNVNSGLCVQDPLEHCKNLVQKVKGTQYDDFLSLSQETVSILQKMNLE